jgi:hypothetical protein
VIRLNALKHGLLAREVVLPGEDADALPAPSAQASTWRSQCGQREAPLSAPSARGLLEPGSRGPQGDCALPLAGTRAQGGPAEKADPLLARILPARARPSLLSARLCPRSRLARKTRLGGPSQHRDEVLLGRALDADAKEGDAFAKLARYERGIERSLFRTLNELRQMQDKRRNPRSSSIPDAVTLDANDIR